MNLSSLFLGFLQVVEDAISDPENKEAVKLVRDGLIMWRDISARPAVLQFEADIGAYGKFVAARQSAQPDRPPLPGEGPQPDVHVGGRPSGTDSGLMRGE